MKKRAVADHFDIIIVKLLGQVEIESGCLAPLALPPPPRTQPVWKLIVEYILQRVMIHSELTKEPEQGKILRPGRMQWIKALSSLISY